MPANPTVKFNPSITVGVVAHQIEWHVNGVLLSTKSIPVNTIFPKNAITQTFSQGNPTASPLVPGDIVRCEVAAVDGSGLLSVEIPVSVTIPTDPPVAPTGVTLTL